MALDRAKARSNADKYIRANRLQDAVKELQKLADDSPRDIQVLNQIGNLYLRMGNKISAVPMFLKVAELYNKNGFATKAVASLKIATREQPDNLPAWEMLASLSEQQGFSREARLAYGEVCDLLTKSGDLKALIGVHNKILELEPENIKARIQLGDNYLKLDRKKEGVKEYLKAANQLVTQGYVKEAARLFERALQLGPENLRALESLVKNLLGHQQAAQALEMLDDLLEKHPTAESLLLLKIETLAEDGKFQEAEAVCRELMKAHPDSSRAFARQVRLMVAQKRYDHACEIVDGWAARSDVSKLPEIEALYQEILHFSPGHLPSLSGLCEVFRRTGATTDLVSALASLAASAEEKNEPQTAREALSEIVQLDPDNTGHLERLRQFGVDPPEPPTVKEAEKSADEEAGREPEVEAKPDATGELEIEVEVEDLELPQPDVTLSLASPDGELSAAGTEPETESESASLLSPLQDQRGKEKVIDARAAEIIREQLTEAEVFLKYGFSDKAIAELQSILKKVPDHIHAHQKLIAIYRKQDKSDKAVKQIVKLAAIFRDQGEKETCENLLDEARAIDPNNEALLSFSEESEAQVEVVLEEPAVEEPVEPREETGRQEAGSVDLDLGLLVPVSEESPGEQEGEELEISLDGAESSEADEEPAADDPGIELQEERESAVGGELYPESESDERDASEGMPEEKPEETTEEEDVLIKKAADEPARESGDDLSIDLSEADIEADTEILEQLEEAEFYLSQELFGEAKRALQAMEDQWPGDQRVLAFRERFERASAAEPFPQPESASMGQAADDEGQEGAESRGKALLDEVEPAAGEEAREQSGEASAKFDAADLFDESSEHAIELGLDESAELGVDSGPGGEPAVAKGTGTRSRTKLKVTLSELLPEEVLAQDRETFSEAASKDEYFDLASELGAALDGLQTPEEEAHVEDKSPEEMSFEEVFEEFKRGVEQKVGEEDYSTHYNLGIAYKEMELMDEAIGEFQIAARSPQYFVECCSMLGICFREKGLSELAEKWYRKGIGAPGFTDEAYIGLKYDLAETLAEQGREGESLELFKEVYAVNTSYRDIKEKVDGHLK